MNRYVPYVISALLILSSSMATAQLGRGGGKGGSNGGSSGGSTSGGRGGGSSPPVKDGGSKPPTRGTSGGGGGLGRGSSGGGGGSSSGGSSGGRGGVDPPDPPTRGGSSGGRGSGSGGRGGGSSLPPINGGRSDSGFGSGIGRGGQDGFVAQGRQSNESSRSGRVTYGKSDHNVNRGVRTSINMPAPPTIRGESRVSREAYDEKHRIQVNPDRYRQGYYHYNNRWHDNQFWYPYYGFQYSYNCYPSPFYYYPHLPGYISEIRVVIGGTHWQISGSVFDWQYRDYRYDDWGWSWGRNDRDNRDLTYAVNDIYDAFRYGSIRTIGRMIPTRGRVTIELGNYARYQLSGDDFYDMMRDLVEGTYTTDYRIREVRNDGRRASVRAEHEYRDPWGRLRRVDHFYGLESTGRGYEIVYFASSE